MNAVLERVRRGSIPGYSRMSSGVRGLLVRPDDSFFNANNKVDNAQQNTVPNDQLPADPTAYMILCLIADLLIWTLAVFIIYRAIQSCRKSNTSEEAQKMADKYDRLEADELDSCSVSSSDSDLQSYADVKISTKWIPVMFTNDGKIRKMTSDQMRTFILPKFALHKWHSIPSIPNIVGFDQHGANFV